jgi:uncharacterized protein YozE (UPF0346 family)
MPVMSYYDWIIQFLNDNNDLAVTSKIIHDDPDFPKDISNYEKLRNYLKDNFDQNDTQLLIKIRASFRLYQRSIQA